MKQQFRQTAGLEHRPLPAQSDDRNGYYVPVCLFRGRVPYFAERDLHRSTRDAIVADIITGEIEPIRVLAFDELRGWCRDVSLAVAREVARRAWNSSGRSLGQSGRTFLDRYGVAEEAR